MPLSQLSSQFGSQVTELKGRNEKHEEAYEDARPGKEGPASLTLRVRSTQIWRIWFLYLES